MNYYLPLKEISKEQEFALNALNQLQNRTDQSNQLYSTFAKQIHSFCTANTRYKISQSELLVYLKEFISKKCSNIDIETQEDLARISVLAQKEYIIAHCQENDESINTQEGLSTNGTWVLPNILGRRDLILVW